MFEEFLAIPGFPDHALDTMGNIWNTTFVNNVCPNGKPKLKMLKQSDWTNQDKSRIYKSVQLRRNGKAVAIGVHQVVALVYCGPQPSPSHMALHRDDNPQNNSPANIYWGTGKQNTADCRKNGNLKMGSKHHAATIDESTVAAIREMRASGASYKSIAEKFSIRFQMVAKIVRRERWKHVP